MLKTIIFHLKIGFGQQVQFLKAKMAYQEDFWIGLVANTLLHVVNLIFINVIFEQTKSLAGWGKYDVFFIYGMSIIPYSLFHGLFSNIYYLANDYIVEGNLDRILLRPVNSLYQIYTQKVELEDLSDIFLGIGILIYSSLALHLHWGILEYFGLIFFVICGVAVFVGVFTTLSCLSFWFSDRTGLIPPVYNMMQFGRYPVTIYNSVVKFILSWIIPFAFIGFYPSTWFIRRAEFSHFLLITPVVAFGCMFVGYLTWHFGLRRYESTGS